MIRAPPTKIDLAAGRLEVFISLRTEKDIEEKPKKPQHKHRKSVKDGISPKMTEDENCD
jgi:hypothetical protein